MEFLNNLNESQKKAVLHQKGPLLVLAGAGSGKTRVITSKIASLLSLGVSPENILAITFTNKAAKEMKERVKKSTLGDIKKLTISTFHALGLRILKEEYAFLGYKKDFSIFGTGDQEALLKDIYNTLKIKEEEMPLGLFLYLMGTKKNKLQIPDMIEEKGSPFYHIYALYQKQLKLQNAFDFDDLILQPLLLFQENKEVLSKWASFYHYILVDEYQDTNFSQYSLIKMLSSIHQNICAVGDDDQSIYSFRGADIGNILRFKEDFKDAQIVVLNKNYRNSARILDTSYSIIAHNKNRHPKDVESMYENKNEGEKILLYEAEDPEMEAEFIASEIFNNRIEHKIEYKNQAILCRTNAQMRLLEKGLRQKNIPYKVIGGFSFFDRSEIKTVMAYLRLLNNTLDNQAFYRVIQFPKRGIGDKTLEVLSFYAAENNISMFDAALRSHTIQGLSPKYAEKINEFALQIVEFKEMIENKRLSQTINEMYKKFEIKEELFRVYKEEAPLRISALDELVSMIVQSELRRKQEGDGFYTLQKFLQEILLSSLKDEEEDEQQNSTYLITIHSAKGLEYNVVFIPGFEEGIFPHERSIKDGEKAIEEERRLCYVAFTRAKTRIILTYTTSRKSWGEQKICTPSRFLEEIPKEHLEVLDTEMQEKLFQDKNGPLLYLEKIKDILKN